MKKIFLLLYCLLLLIINKDLLAQSFWKKQGNETAPMALHSGILYVPATNTILTSTYNGGIFKSNDDGIRWEQVLSLPKDQPIYSFFITSKGTILAGGEGKIYRSKTNGDKWEEIPIDFADVKKIIEDDKANLYLNSSYSQGILMSADDGLSWRDFNAGLTNTFVNNLVSDKQGNLFCTVIDAESVGTGGLYYWSVAQKQWVQKEIKVDLDGTNFKLRVDFINAIAISNEGKLYLSFTGTATNFAVSGVFRNSIEKAINQSTWQRELMDDSGNIPLSTLYDYLYVTKTGHLFGSRKSSTGVGIYSKMSYRQKWIETTEGIAPVYDGLAFMTEKPDGTLLLTTEFSNKIYATTESKPGKKVQQINFMTLYNMNLYEEAALHATSSSGLAVKFKSLNTNQAYVEGNHMRAVGLGGARVKAFIDGNDSLYYAEVVQNFIIHKAKNTIEIDLFDDIMEYEKVPVRAKASSGLPVQLQIVRGKATIVNDTLIPTGPGRIEIMATEPGNETYVAADTLVLRLCAHPHKPSIIIERAEGSGQVTLKASKGDEYQWFHNGQKLAWEKDYLVVKEPGDYFVVILVEGCISPPSDRVTITDIEDDIFKNSLKVYPVPFADNLIINRSAVGFQERFTFQLVDLYGRIIKSHLDSKEEIIHLQTVNIPAGVYLLKVQSGNRRAIFKLIKQP